MIPFDSFVAVDWSGAKGKSYSGIAVAQCGPGDSAPRLVRSQHGKWRRHDFVEWLVAQADKGERLAVGIDCNFALPEAAGRAIMGRPYAIMELWDHIDRICAGDADFYGGGMADHDDYAPLFWRSGSRPQGFIEHRRATELACRDQNFGTPESSLKLVGARQVGKGSLAGMRVLAAMKRRLGNDLAVWPFDPIDDARIVCVEVYPRLFLRATGHGNTKVRTLDDLDRCLDRLGSHPYPDRTAVPTDDEADALVAAAGLRHIAGSFSVWAPTGLDNSARRAEGWIFGVA